MSGVEIRVTVDDAPARAVLAKLREMTGDLKPVMEQIGAQLALHVDQRFEKGRGPGGVPWLQSERAKRDKGLTLVDTARLRQSITWDATDDSVTVGTNVVYAAIHQLGGSVTRAAYSRPGMKFRRRENKSVRFAKATDTGDDIFARNVTFGERETVMPARPFLGFDQGDQDEVLAIVEDEVRRILAAAPAAGGAP